MEKDQNELFRQENYRPLEQCMGLSPIQMNALLYKPFTEVSPVQLRHDTEDASLDQIPLFGIAEALLHIIKNAGELKLTATDALPKKVVLELYEKKLISEFHLDSGMYKLSKESDSHTVTAARYGVEYGRLARKANGKFMLQKATIQLLEKGDRIALFKQFLLGFSDKYLWASPDGFVNQNFGQYGWAYSLYMLLKCGKEQTNVQFYVDKYLLAFPGLYNEFLQESDFRRKDLLSCYALRTFKRNFAWLGLVNVLEEKTSILEEPRYNFQYTGLADQLFTIAN